MEDEYKKACTQVSEILKYLIDDGLNIPRKEVEYYLKNSDELYNFKFNPNVPFNKQGILRKTYAILVTIYRDFCLEDNKKSVLNDILVLNEKV